MVCAGGRAVCKRCQTVSVLLLTARGFVFSLLREAVTSDSGRAPANNAPIARADTTAGAKGLVSCLKLTFHVQ